MIPCSSSWTFYLGISFILVAAFAAISSSQYIPAPPPSYSTGYQQPNVYNVQTAPIRYTQHQVVQQPGVGTTGVIDRTVSSQNYRDPQTGHLINARTAGQQETRYDPLTGRQLQVQQVSRESTDLQTGIRDKTSIATINEGGQTTYIQKHTVGYGQGQVIPGTVIQPQVVQTPVVSNGYPSYPAYPSQSLG